MLCSLRHENHGQNAEHEGLNQANEEFQAVEAEQDGRRQRAHHEEQHATRKNVAEQPEGEGENLGKLGDEFQQTHCKIQRAHRTASEGAEVEELLQIVQALRPQPDDLRHDDRNQSQSQGEVQIRRSHPEEGSELVHFHLFCTCVAVAGQRAMAFFLVFSMPVPLFMVQLLGLTPKQSNRAQVFHHITVMRVMGRLYQANGVNPRKQFHPIDDQHQHGDGGKVGENLAGPLTRGGFRQVIQYLDEGHEDVGEAGEDVLVLRHGLLHPTPDPKAHEEHQDHRNGPNHKSVGQENLAHFAQPGN